MRVTITGISFIFNNGYEEDYTGIELNYIVNGFRMNDNTPVQISKEQYQENKDNPNALRALIVDKKIENIVGYTEELEAYKASLLEQ